MSTTTTPLTALVFGASGITGHAILKTLLTYPTPSTFARIIGLTNRPLTTADSHLEADQRVELYSGIDLLDREKSLLQLQHVPGIQQVTHAYYASYAGHGQDFEELKRVNSELLTNAIGGVEICCPDLRFVTLNTGGKVSTSIESPQQSPTNPRLSGIRNRIPHLSPLQPAPPRRPSQDPRTVRQQHFLLRPARHSHARQRRKTLVLLRNPARCDCWICATRQFYEYGPGSRDIL